MGRAGQGGGIAGTVTDPGGAGATLGPTGGRLGGMAAVGPARLAQGGPGHAPPQERSRSAGGVEKKLPEMLASTLRQVDLRGRSVRLMFQDEARFGRMARPRRCWAPLPWRPVMFNGYERQFVYVYGAVSPLQGDFDWMLCGEMNTLRMGEFLGQVSRAHPNDFMVMIVDGASSHRAKDLAIPENIRLSPLLPYAPELNPQEIYGMNCEKRSSRIGCSTTSMP
jgi:DDE superfamily endonuclease